MKLLTFAGFILIAFSFYQILKTPDMTLMDKLLKRKKEKLEEMLEEQNPED